MIEIVAAYDDDDDDEYDYVSPSLRSQDTPYDSVTIDIEAPPPLPLPPKMQEDKDGMLQHLMDLIEKKEQFIARKQKQLREISKQNEFLQSVRQDYGKYNQFILRQKHDQLAAFQLLQQHLDQLAQTGELSEQNAKDAQAEQQKILQEIDSIKSGLDELMAEYEG